MMFAATPKGCCYLLAAVMTALSSSCAALPFTTHHTSSGLPEHTGPLAGATLASPGNTLTLLDPGAGPDNLATSLSSTAGGSGRQLQAVPAVVVTAVTVLADKVLSAMIAFATGRAGTAIFGSQAVPVNLAQLINDALTEVDRIVGDRIAEAFTNDKHQQLQSLGQQVREYTRRINLETSRGKVWDMLRDASGLLSFFHANGVVTNSAYQVTLSLRLYLLVELLQLDELIGETEVTLETVRGNIRAQAASGRAALERWAATYLPTKNTVQASRSYITKGCSSPGCNRKLYYKGSIVVRMVLESPGLEKPAPFVKERRAICKANHLIEKRRRDHINQCLDRVQDEFEEDIKEHVEEVAMDEFRALNEAAVFGEDFQEFLGLLREVEELDFEGVGLPEP